MPPSFAAAAGLGFRAAAREAWLVPVGAVVAAARRAALWPALGALALAAVRAAGAAWSAEPLHPAAPFAGALAALGSPRVRALAMGLAAAGVLLSAALRVAWLAGALPTLGAALAGGPREPRFAAGIAYDLPRVLATALLGLAAELGAWGLAAALAVSGAGLAVRAGSSSAGAAVPLAAAGAMAFALAAAAPLAATVLADAAIARAAVRGEGPGRALAAAARRLRARPGTFALAGVAFAAIGIVAPLSAEGMGGAALGFAQGAPAIVRAGPQLMLVALAAVVAAGVDVWRLATFAALACGGSPDRLRAP